MRPLLTVGLILLILLALMTLPGCWVMSVYPLYEDEEVQIADPGLAGQWWQPEGDCRLSITLAQTWSGKREFALEYSAPEKGAERANSDCAVDDGEGPAKLRGRLVDVQGHLFLDVLPSEGEGFQMMPVHSIFRVAVRNDELDVVPLDPEFIKKAIRDKTVEGRDDGPVITAPTAEWRKFVLGAVDDVSAFTEVKNDRRLWHFVRMPAGLPPRAAPPKPACAE